MPFLRIFNRGRRDHLTDPTVEAALFTSRAIFMVIFGVLLIAVLVARLYHLQVNQYQHFSTLSTNNRVHLIALAPARGLIFDRYGEVLAHNLPSFQLELTAEDVDDMEQTLLLLSEVVQYNPSDLKRFRKALRRAQPFQGVPLKFNLTEQQVAQFSVVQHDFPGVDIVARLQRHYPNGAMAGHTIGYVGRINEKEVKRIDPVNYRATRDIGKIGIEKQFEELLHGKVGHQQVEVNVSSRVLRILEESPPTPGVGIYLTLDSQLQRVAEEALGDNSGAIAAIDPRNGEVLALVSKPGFDINLFVGGISFKDYGELRDDWRRPLFNRTLSGTYPPGSTIKPFIALGALETGVVTTYSRKFCPGYYQLPHDDHLYRDWKKTGHGHVNVKQALTQSCDVMFYNIAHKMGIDPMADYLSEFGFGDSTGIDLSPESNGILPSSEWKKAYYGQVWYPGETLIVGIGQGYFTATPIQLAHATAVLANGGRNFVPQILYALQPDSSAEPLLIEHQEQMSVPIINQENWEYVIDGMRAVTSSARGTARRAFHGAEYSIAGKTGTAQVFSIAQDAKYDKSTLEKRLQDHALFVAFAPVESPTFALVVIVENGGGGGAVAAPIARKIMDEYLLRDRHPSATSNETTGKRSKVKTDG